MSRENLVLCSYEIDDVKKDVKQKVHPITFIGIGSSILAEWCPRMRLMLKAILEYLTLRLISCEQHYHHGKFYTR